jgi:hypothetical protein
LILAAALAAGSLALAGCAGGTASPAGGTATTAGSPAGQQPPGSPAGQPSSQSAMPGAAAAGSGLTWGTPAVLDGANSSTAPVLWPSCAPGDFCVIVDSLGNAITYSGGAWSKPVPADGAVARANATANAGGQLRAAMRVSCASAQFCMATDTLGNWLAYNGTGWGTPSPMPLRGTTPGHVPVVSCAAPGFCLAVGGNQYDVYSNGTWSAPAGLPAGMRQSVPLTAGAQQGEAYALSCASATFCTAVGPGNGNAGTAAATFNGSSWSAFTTIDSVGTEGLIAVSCPSAAFCAAVDDGGGVNDGGAVTFNGSTWSPRSPLGAGFVQSVSCTSSTFCAASDVTGGGTGGALAFNGSSWSPAGSVGPATVSVVLSCGSPSLCVAVLDGSIVSVGT